MVKSAHITAIHPTWGIEGGRITILGDRFPIDSPQLPGVRMAEARARLVFASPHALGVLVPASTEGRVPVHVDGVTGETPLLEVGGTFATGLHQVDNPVFDRDGNLYVTYSGTRGQQVPVSIFRVRPSGTRETFASGIVNPTSMAIDARGWLYVSSRFEGTVYRVAADGSSEPFATDLGVACGLAFSKDGTLYVGDRSGTIFRVTPSGQASAFATLPPSVAAFHLAMGPNETLYVSAPTLSSYDSIYRIAADGSVAAVHVTFGRPQGIAFDEHGTLFVVEALAGVCGLYRVAADREPELMLAAPSLVGVAFDPHGGLIVCSNESAYRLAVDVRPLPL